jgi:hypothetical protein
MEIVYMTPKETGVDAIENQRPLKLQEALKKVTVGIRKDRMANACGKDLGCVVLASTPFYGEDRPFSLP